MSFEVAIIFKKLTVVDRKELESRDGNESKSQTELYLSELDKDHVVLTTIMDTNTIKFVNKDKSLYLVCEIS